VLGGGGGGLGGGGVFCLIRGIKTRTGRREAPSLLPSWLQRLRQKEKGLGDQGREKTGGRGERRTSSQGGWYDSTCKKEGG